MKLTDEVNEITLTKVCSIKAFESATDSKTITLNVKFDGVTLGDVFSKAVSSAVIQWQNGPGRKQFNNWTNQQTVEIQFKSPGKVTVDPETAMIAKLQAMSSDEQIAYLKNLASKVKPEVPEVPGEDGDDL